MKKIFGRMVFMLTFFWMGTAYAVAAHSESAEAETGPAPRAIECSAAFELMNRAAREWSQQTEVVNARLAWADYVNAVSRANGADASEQVANEMTLIAQSLADDPAPLAELALGCVLDAPNLPSAN